MTFNISVPGQGGRVASNIRDGWYRVLGIQAVTPICEDLYIIALSVFATDKRIPRSKTPDNWTREVHLNVPVIMVDQWNFVKEELERMLGYLSGDLWHFTFRSCEIENRYKDNHVHAPARNTLLNRIDGVSLFSGGLDSFCGAYDLMMNSKNTVFVGFKEYGKLESVQSTLMDSLNCCFPDIVKLLFTFTARACCPLGTENLPPENDLSNVAKVESVPVEVTTQILLLVYLIGTINIVVSVVLSSAKIIRMKPKQILSKMD